VEIGILAKPRVPRHTAVETLSPLECDGGLVYWTMGAPLEETIIVNRCRREDTYENRLLKGTLPGLKSIANERIRIDCVSEANHNLIRLLDKPGDNREA
jgi:hypothetical protein